MTAKRIKTIDMIYVAVGAVLLTVCSWITVPMTVPFTLQTFAVFSVLLILGGYRGTLSILIYMMMGAVGLPVFSGFKGGVGVLFGNTGGYIIGFLFTGLVYIAMTKLIGKKLFIEITALTLGLFVCYAFGTAWFRFLYIRNTGDVGLLTVLTWCVFPFIIPDICKMILAFVISYRVRRALGHFED